jgi:Uma2 family endonuclease
MDTLLDTDLPTLTADEFMRTDQRVFGDAGRYELLDGRPVAMAPPTDKHAIIAGRLVHALALALAASGLPCDAAVGPGVRPANARQTRVLIPDVAVLCGDKAKRRPVVLVEILSPSNKGTSYDERRKELMAVEGVEEVVEMEQDSVEACVYRRREDGWQTARARGEKAKLELESLGISVRLGPLYADL